MNYLKLQNGSDIRGVAISGVPNEKVNLTNIETYNISISFAKWLSAKVNKPLENLKITVGYDSRLSAPSLKGGIFNGFIKVGVKPIDCGITSTPSTFMTTIFEDIKADGAIMITASHLPYNRNGMKFFTKEGGLDKKDIHFILENIETEAPYDDCNCDVEYFDLASRYSQHISELIRKEVNASNYEKPLENMNIIVDAGNGAGGFFAKKVLEELGATTSGSQFLNPDGNFPNHIPNPEDKEAIESIIKATLSANADLGIIFDTDVDRAAVIDKTGKAINRNKLIALMSAIVLENNQKSTIVTDSVTSTGLTEFIESLGGIHHRYKRGYKNVINESVRLNNSGVMSDLAIETSGHGAFKDNYFLDDGAYIVTKILIKLAQLRKEGKDISDLIATLKEPKDEVDMRIKITTEDFASYGNNVLEEFKSFVENDSHFTIVSPNYEGVRVNYDYEGTTGWVLVRMSLHDPVIPVNMESNYDNGCDVVKNVIINFFERFDKLNIPK